MYANEKFDASIPMTSKNFQKVLSFYLFGCPVEGTSIRADTFAQRGWKGKLFTTLKSNMLKTATPELRERYYPCTKTELDMHFKAVENLSELDEYCVFLKHDQAKVMESLFSAIRNAFAHGSFTRKRYKKTYVYFFANYDGYLKAEIRLHEETLLNWIKLVNSDPYSLRRKS